MLDPFLSPYGAGIENTENRLEDLAGWNRLAAGRVGGKSSPGKCSRMRSYCLSFGFSTQLIIRDYGYSVILRQVLARLCAA